MNRFAQTARQRSSLGQLMVGKGLIQAEDLEHALEYRRQHGLRLGQALMKLGLIDSKQLSEVLREQGKLACVSLRPELVDARVARRLGEETSRKLKAIAINEVAGITTVAMDDPADVYALDELTRTLHSKVYSVYCSPDEIEECLEAVFSGGAPGEDDHAGLDEIVDSALDGAVDLELGSEFGAEVEESSEDLDGPVVNLIQAIFKEAFEANASDIHLEVRDSTFVVRFRVDGALFDRMTLKKGWARPCIARIKVLSNLDIAQRRLPQDGRTRISVHGRKVDLRVSTLPTLLGEGAVIRILDGGRGIQSLANLGLREDQESCMREMVMHGDGIVLAVGPTGSGKTTTLYALLAERNNAETKIITLEDPVENQIESICQINCDVKAGLTFSRGLRSILRQDPDVILVGEIRDPETAEISVSAALTGHMVLSTLHTIGSAETIPRLREMEIDPFLLSDTLRGIVAQRLIRVICPTCKVEEEVDAKVREQHGLSDAALYRGAGCPNCNGTGYKGRRGLVELMEINADLRDGIRTGADADRLRAVAREDGLRTMREEGLRLASMGLTTLSEVLATTPRAS